MYTHFQVYCNKLDDRGMNDMHDSREEGTILLGCGGYQSFPRGGGRWAELGKVHRILTSGEKGKGILTKDTMSEGMEWESTSVLREHQSVCLEFRIYRRRHRWVGVLLWLEEVKWGLMMEMIGHLECPAKEPREVSTQKLNTSVIFPICLFISNSPKLK